MSESVKETIDRVMQQAGYYDHPYQVGERTFYVDGDSPFVQNRAGNNVGLNNMQRYNQETLNNTANANGQGQSPWYKETYDKVYDAANQLRDSQISDKYKHSVVSCIGAQDGWFGTMVTGAMGIGKEVQDISRKFPRQWSGQQDYGGYGAILMDSAADLVADAQGLYQGFKHRFDNCFDLMKPYYDPNKK